MQVAAHTKVILLDIEGTTTPIDFVYQVLFPYARQHVQSYLAAHWDDVQADLAQLQREHAADEQQGLQPPVLDTAQLTAVVAYLHWLMDRDRKATPLKSLQGKVWEEGYKSGALKSQLFADVPRAFENWQQQGKRIAIFSSGSVLAQKLLFTYTEYGDLSGFISGWFDTNVGPKREADSYRRIASALLCAPHEVSFISDVTAELEAAKEAGMQTFLSLRPGNPPQPNADSFAQLTHFL
ncbi:MAG TPA: acireductone synthase [Blastocatellia bacterium]|nr:acireductone synthase [Blastocatellia bacterium]